MKESFYLQFSLGHVLPTSAQSHRLMNDGN